MGIDPTVCSYFLVIEYVHEEGAGVGVDIYSSKTAVWIFKESERGMGIILRSHLISVFLNGFMYILEYSLIVAVDMDRKTWRKIRKPCAIEISIHQAQGHSYVPAFSLDT